MWFMSTLLFRNRHMQDCGRAHEIECQVKRVGAAVLIRSMTAKKIMLTISCHILYNITLTHMTCWTQDTFKRRMSSV